MVTASDDRKKTAERTPTLPAAQVVTFREVTHNPAVMIEVFSRGRRARRPDPATRRLFGRSSQPPGPRQRWQTDRMFRRPRNPHRIRGRRPLLALVRWLSPCGRRAASRSGRLRRPHRSLPRRPHRPGVTSLSPRRRRPPVGRKLAQFSLPRCPHAADSVLAARNRGITPRARRWPCWLRE